MSKQWYRIEYMDDPEAEGACMSCNEDGVKYVPVTIDENLIVESDVPDGQGHDWVIVQVPKAGRYAVVPVDAAIGGNDE